MWMGLSNLLDPLDDFFLFNDVNYVKRCRSGYCNYFDVQVRNPEVMVAALIIPHVMDLLLFVVTAILALADSSVLDTVLTVLILLTYLVKPVFQSLSWRGTEDVMYSVLHYISDVSRFVLYVSTLSQLESSFNLAKWKSIINGVIKQSYIITSYLTPV
jgi:hypothetical protein